MVSITKDIETARRIVARFADTCVLANHSQLSVTTNGESISVHIETFEYIGAAGAAYEITISMNILDGMAWVSDTEEPKEVEMSIDEAFKYVRNNLGGDE